MDKNVVLDIIKLVAAPLFAIIVQYILKRYDEKGPRVIHYFQHSSATVVSLKEQAPIQVHSHGLIVKNVGDKPARNVKIYNARLDGESYLSIWPDVSFEEVKLPNGGREICVPILVPNEQITLSYLYSPPVMAFQFMHTVKHDEGFSNAIAVSLTPIPSNIQLWVNRVLTFLGLSTVIYFAIDFAQMYLHTYVH